jgi:hypothetical protein
MVHLEHEKKINAKQKGVLNSENQQPIKLKTPTLLATKSDLDEQPIANLLQEYMDVFPSEIPLDYHLSCLQIFGLVPPLTF